MFCRLTLATLMLVLLPWLTAQAQPSNDDALVFNTEEYPPFNFINARGDIDGTSTRLLQHALARLDVDVEFRLLPWARAYTEARLRDANCVYSTNRTRERSPLFQWVGPLEQSDWSAFALRERDLQLATLNELRHFKVGSAHEDAVGIYVSEQGVPVINASRDGENINRLKAGIIDVWVTSSPLAPHMAAKQGVQLDNLFTFNQTQLYLACHPSVDADFLTRLQEAVDQVRDSDEFAAERALILEPVE
ncbi:substrate-binding periplasmic protein [Halopseudomonas salegens]|uniref:Amino acid ABC transporter substrate-binding protein, PAAT family n=1 Tax=Halopseudomonas salegens TaxID=1434072 RepID=A0A1H2FC53_9GAMM|nr:transporter substrate-binding domain-containing protein [Halopseudomonas salegens]SDU04956.1 amino acid ABC transporter substrate-binding protein, PAAT family [Halopseudomonas salegens]